eukprot:gb/GFBE01007793.1/.p1 GENE.gb/GFBE01007793.1/~~gb/GFBE01007793.1/.p1  ORF type:complete len:299 (+),score=40.13 gb/GFBE01007793.1/:1-897(+)
MAIGEGAPFQLSFTPKKATSIRMQATCVPGSFTPPFRPRHPDRLMHAICMNRADLVQDILAADSSTARTPVNHNFSQEMPLVKAIRLRCSTQVLQLLREHGADINEPPCSAEVAPLSALAGAPPQLPRGLRSSSESILPPLAPLVPLSGGPIPMQSYEDTFHRAAISYPPGADLMSDIMGELQDQIGSLWPSAVRQSPDSAGSQKWAREKEEEELSIAKWLLAMGADSRRCDEDGRTAADWAGINRKVRLELFLRSVDDLRELKLLQKAIRKSPKQHGILALPTDLIQRVSGFLAVAA